MNRLSGMLGRVEGGTDYSKLTKAQKKAVDVFHGGRKITEGEKKERYFFDQSGKCVSAT